MSRTVAIGVQDFDLPLRVRRCSLSQAIHRWAYRDEIPGKFSQGPQFGQKRVKK